MKAGDAILVVLAAANHDPAANPSPERFDVSRTDRKAFTFGLGPHACPGEAIAAAIAHAGVAALLAAGVEPARLRSDVRYRPSANVRIPLLNHPA
jgi:cytochrome P450